MRKIPKRNSQDLCARTSVQGCCLGELAGSHYEDPLKKFAGSLYTNPQATQKIFVQVFLEEFTRSQLSTTSPCSCARNTSDASWHRQPPTRSREIGQVVLHLQNRSAEQIHSLVFEALNSKKNKRAYFPGT